MKNVYIIDEYISSAKNGIGTFLKAYISCLLKMDVNICRIVFNAKSSEFSISFKGNMREISFPEFSGGNFMNHPQIIDKFFRLYIEDSPDNIFCFNHAPCDKLLQTVRKSHPLSKLVFFIHDQLWTNTFKGKEKMYLRVIQNKDCPEIRKEYLQVITFYEAEQRMYETADAIITLSPSTYSILCRIYNITRAKLWLIQNGLRRTALITNGQKKELRKQFNIKSDEKIILYVGRITELKGIVALQKAFDKVNKDYPMARLVIAGPIVDQSICCLYNKSLSHITYTGLIKPKELKKWYQIADIGVIPSYTEQCTYVGIEMMMHGIPIVVSDGFGLCDMFNDGDNALIAPIGRINTDKTFSSHLAFAIKTLLSSDVLRQKLGQNARKEYMANYTLNRMQERYKYFFKEL